MSIRRWFSGSLSGLLWLTAVGIVTFANVSGAIADADNDGFDADQAEYAGYEELWTGIPDSAVAYTLNQAEGSAAGQDFENDPWESFNETMFSFNRNLDLYLIKPLAQGWDFILPAVVRRSIRNLVDNTKVVPRLVNSIAQGKLDGAGRELARFTINSTIGVAGLFDVAKDGMGIRPSDEDMGQTMGFYGVEPGPYLVLPFFPPMTVRDGFGYAVDGAMNPLNYLLPYAAHADRGTTTGVIAGIAFVDAVNERSLNLDKFQQVEESVIDLYSAVRNGYLQRRAAAVKE